MEEVGDPDGPGDSLAGGGGGGGGRRDERKVQKAEGSEGERGRSACARQRSAD